MSIRKEVLELLTKVPVPPEDSTPAGVTDEQLNQFEATNGITIPRLLREWLLMANGPCVGPGGVVGITTKRESQDAESILGNYPEWREKGWFPVAGDGCGNYYVVATRNDYGDGEPVLFVDINDDSSEPAFLAASNTWSFLRFLLQKELDETRWPYSESEVIRDDPEITSFAGVSLPWDA